MDNSIICSLYLPYYEAIYVSMAGVARACAKMNVLLKAQKSNYRVYWMHSNSPATIMCDTNQVPPDVAEYVPVYILYYSEKLGGALHSFFSGKDSEVIGRVNHFNHEYFTRLSR